MRIIATYVCSVTNTARISEDEKRTRERLSGLLKFLNEDALQRSFAYDDQVSAKRSDVYDYRPHTEVDNHF